MGKDYKVWPDFVNMAFYLKCGFAGCYPENNTLVNASTKLLDAISVYTGDASDKPLQGYKYRGRSYSEVDADKVVRLARRIDNAIDKVEACFEVRSLCSKLYGNAQMLKSNKKAAAKETGAA